MCDWKESVLSRMTLKLLTLGEGKTGVLLIETEKLLNLECGFSASEKKHSFIAVKL